MGRHAICNYLSGRFVEGDFYEEKSVFYCWGRGGYYSELKEMLQKVGNEAYRDEATLLWSKPAERALVVVSGEQLKDIALILFEEIMK